MSPNFSNEIREVRRTLAKSYPRINPFSLLGVLVRYGSAEATEALFLRNSKGEPKNFILLRDRIFQGRLRYPRTPSLFSASFYDSANPDVSKSGINPWLHYEVLGREEGRSPHPLLDPKYLSDQLDVPIGLAVDEYILRSENFLIQPSPFFNVEAFFNSGKWDGETNPVLQIVSERIDFSEWFVSSLAESELRNLNSQQMLETFLGLEIGILHQKPMPNIFASWKLTSELPIKEMEKRVLTVFPGVFIASANEAQLISGWEMNNVSNQVLIAENLLFSKKFVNQIEVETLLLLDGAPSTKNFQNELRELPFGSAISTSDAHSQIILNLMCRILARTDIVILEFNKPMGILADKVIFQKLNQDVQNATFPELEINEAQLRSSVVLLDESSALVAQNNKEFMDLILRGLTVFTVTEKSVGMYLESLYKFDDIYIHHNLTWLERAIPAGKCRIFHSFGAGY